MGAHSGKRVFFVFSSTMLLSALLASPGSASSTVKKIRYSVQSDYTRIVLDLTCKTPYRIVRYKNPERIAINMKRVIVEKGVRPPAIPGGIVKRVRVNRLSWGSQVVIDLREEANWKHFILTKNKSHPDRIVVDVYPSSPSARSSAQARVRDKKGTQQAMSMDGGSKTPSTRSTKSTQSAGGVFTVAIDAGHGGMDPGAKGRYGLVEKYLALDFAKQIVREINNHEGFKAVLTRTKDVYLTLPQRTQIAQRKGADIFVSIHMNGSKNRRARGKEIFFISPAGASAKASRLMSNKKMAMSELGLKERYSDDLLSLLLDVNQKAMMHRSSLLAEEILKAMRKKGFPPSRGVKQKAFAVLKTIVMPSVLVEAGFITNAQDAKFLKSDNGREKVSKAIASGIISYLKRYPPPSAQNKEVIVHKVKKGETLWRISRLYGSSVRSIQEANGLKRSSAIQVGQELLIFYRK